MINIESATGRKIMGNMGGPPRFHKVNILCDTEQEILDFGKGEGHVIEESSDPNAIRVKPLPSSIARTAGAGVIYELSPSYVRTKM